MPNPQQYFDSPSRRYDGRAVAFDTPTRRMIVPCVFYSKNPDFTRMGSESALGCTVLLGGGEGARSIRATREGGRVLSRKSVRFKFELEPPAVRLADGTASAQRVAGGHCDRRLWHGGSESS